MHISQDNFPYFGNRYCTHFFLIQDKAKIFQKKNIVYAISIPNDLKKPEQVCYFVEVSQLQAYFKDKFIV